MVYPFMGENFKYEFTRQQGLGKRNNGSFMLPVLTLDDILQGKYLSPEYIYNYLYVVF